MKSKRILLSVINDLTHDRRMRRICDTLAKAGYDVTLTGRRFTSSAPFQSDSFSGYRFKCWINKGVLFYIEYNIRLFVHLLFQKADVLCACDLDTALAVRLAARWKGIPAVYDAHEYFTEVPELTGRPMVKRVWEWIGRWTIPGFKARYTVGEELARIMSERYFVPFDVVRNIEPHEKASTLSAMHTLDLPHSKHVLLYQGAINVGRGLHACIEAMQYLPDWIFLIAGEGDITEELKQKAKQLQIAERVRFLGWVKPAELPSLMKSASLAVNLREKGSLNDYYSAPNKFFDAIHVGLPSINMNYPEYAAICRKYPCAILIDEVDATWLSKAVLDIERFPEKKNQLIAACHEAAREYNWENESRTLLRIYKEVLA